MVTRSSRRCWAPAARLWGAEQIHPMLKGAPAPRLLCSSTAEGTLTLGSLLLKVRLEFQLVKNTYIYI